MTNMTKEEACKLLGLILSMKYDLQGHGWNSEGIVIDFHTKNKKFKKNLNFMPTEFFGYKVEYREIINSKLL